MVICAIIGVDSGCVVPARHSVDPQTYLGLRVRSRYG